jgi:hypothetical protein
MAAIPPSLTLPLKGGGNTFATHNFPLPLEGGGRGGGDNRAEESES